MRALVAWIGVGGLGFTAGAAAQEISPLDLAPRSVEYRFSVVESADFETIPGRRVRSRSDRFTTRFGKHPWRGLELGLGFAWEFTRAEFGGVESRNRDLHRVQVPIIFERPFGAWSLEGYLAPGVATSSNVLRQLPSEGNSSDFTVSARLLAVSDDAASPAWRFGVVSDRRFGTTRAYPTGGVVIRRDRWTWSLVLPDPSVGLQLDAGHRLAAALYPAGGTWHVKNKFTELRSTYFEEGWRAEFRWAWRIHPRLEAGLGIGYLFARRHEFDDDQEIRRRSDVDAAPFAMLTLTGFWGSEPGASP